MQRRIEKLAADGFRDAFVFPLSSDTRRIILIILDGFTARYNEGAFFGLSEGVAGILRELRVFALIAPAVVRQRMPRTMMRWL